MFESPTILFFSKYYLNMKKILGSIDDLMDQKIVQVSLISGILFYILAEPSVFAFVDDLLKKIGKVFNININLQGNQLLLFHSFIFALLMGLSIKFIFEPLFYENGML
tara:strand:+ start:220 stop:543 length:324 start_codon:yes stop_codon:yes gene_type:complete